MLQLERPIIFHPARLLRWKGVLVGLAAFIKLRRQLKHGSLVFCDSAQTVDDPAESIALLAEVREAACTGDVADYVHILRFERDEMPAAYRASDLVWYPTIDQEPYGLAPLEAMACGVPVIVSRSGGMIETVTHNRTGLIVPRADAGALAEATLSLLRDSRAARGFRSRLTREARRAAKCFSITAYVDKLEEIYSVAQYRSKHDRPRPDGLL
jgi:glycosyltransferase involved in cell wall biosynthesis